MNNELIHINAPSLDDVNYATSLSEVFDNINQNFVTLANHDFIKGESGKSVEFVETKFFDENGNITDLGNKLKSCISELGDTTTVIYDDKQNEFTIWDNFTSGTAGCIHMIYNTENDTPLAEIKPISSLQYIFKDGRFANTTIGKISNQSQYDNIADLSCIVIYDNTLNDGNGGFRALTNSISTLYYDKTIGLCWKINGIATGIPAQGIPGKDGKNSKIYIVKCDSYQQPNDDELTEIDSEVTHIYDEVYGYVRLDSFDDEYKRDLFKDVDSMSALILSANSEDMTSGYKFYFGTLYVKDNKLYANYNIEFSLNESVKSEELINYFKNISLLDENLDGASNNRGVFVPISTHDSVKQPVHLMTARPVDPVIDALYVQTNSDELKCNDLLLTPISDITDLEVDIAENKNLCVNRYLKMDFNDEIREYRLNGQYKVNNKKFIDRLKNIYPVLNVNINTNLNIVLKFPEDLIVDEIYEWCYDNPSNKAYLYTLDVNPTKESHILHIKDLTRIEKYDESTGTTQIIGFEINFVFENDHSFIGFYQKILNDFEVNNTTLNLNYDVNVSKSIKPVNVNIDGVVKAKKMSLGVVDWNFTPVNSSTENKLIIDTNLLKNTQIPSSIQLNTNTYLNRSGLTKFSGKEVLIIDDFKIKCDTSIQEIDKAGKEFIVSATYPSVDELYDISTSSVTTFIEHEELYYASEESNKYGKIIYRLSDNGLVNEKWSIHIKPNFKFDIFNKPTQNNPMAYIPEIFIDRYCVGDVAIGDTIVNNFFCDFWTHSKFWIDYTDGVLVCPSTEIINAISDVKIEVSKRYDIGKIIVKMIMKCYINDINKEETIASIFRYDFNYF